jgi:hypothetical protein
MNRNELLRLINEQVVATGIDGQDLAEVRYRLSWTATPILQEMYDTDVVKRAEQLTHERTTHPNGEPAVTSNSPISQDRPTLDGMTRYQPGKRGPVIGENS